VASNGLVERRLAGTETEPRTVRVSVSTNWIDQGMAESPRGGEEATTTTRFGLA